MNTLRSVVLVALLLVATVPLILVQAVAIRVAPRLSRRLPMLVNRLLLVALGVRVHVRGDVTPRRPTVLVANHVSWLDIPVLAAVAPVRFVSKAEVGSWPVIGWLARLVRTVFIERGNHGTIGEKASEVAEALRAGDIVIIFPEGTTSDGNRVLFFKSGLLGGVRSAMEGEDLLVQPISIVHTHASGLPLGRAHRSHAAYPGGVSLGASLRRVLGEGALDVAVDWGEPVPYPPAAERKRFAARLEGIVRDMFVARVADGRMGAGAGGALSPIRRAGGEAAQPS